MSTKEHKEGFIAALAVLLQCTIDVHSIVATIDAKEREIPVASIVQGLIEHGAALEAALGKEAFSLWLDRFLHASSDERGAMWANDGEWHDATLKKLEKRKRKGHTS